MDHRAVSGSKTKWARDVEAGARGMRQYLALSLVFLAGYCSGCMHIPRENLSVEIDAHELSDHVHFLAQPALRGRKPRTIGSWQARQYVKKRFESYGLLPWGDAKAYEHPFGLGTNIIGVLPGTDEGLADQVVLLSAHYDHLGMRDGKPCLGAADNASGVAVLLEVAERLSLGPELPRRSVCFASFDNEEKGFLGAFAFTCREDFDPSRIVAVVNMDILGRACFDVMKHTLIVVGTEEYPAIREAVLQAGNNARVQIMPVGTDVVGPVSDHFAFEEWRVPCLLFTAGYYRDYQDISDTADRLDYEALRRAGGTIYGVVRHLADTESIPQPMPPSGGDLAELRAIKATLDEVCSDYETAGLTRGERDRLAPLAGDAAKLLSEDEYEIADRRRFTRGLVEVVVPIYMRRLGSDAEQKGNGPAAEDRIWGRLVWHEFLATHRSLASQGFRQAIRDYLTSSGGLFKWMRESTYKGCEIVADEISFTRQGDAKYRLSFLYPTFTVRATMTGVTATAHYKGWDFLGHKDSIIDLCLLIWSGEEDESVCRVMRKVLVAVSGMDRGARYEDWLNWHLAQIDVIDDEEAWVIGLWRSTEPGILSVLLSRAAKGLGPEIPAEMICAVFCSDDVRPDIRARAMRAMPNSSGKDCLLGMVNILTDDTPTFKKAYSCVYDPTHPFYHHPSVRAVREHHRGLCQGKTKTLAEVARDKLEELTGKNIGMDSLAWREWIKEHK